MDKYELSAHDLFVLDNLLRKHKTLPIVGAHGFLTAAASSPEQRDIEELMPFLFGGELPPILDEQKENMQKMLNVLYKNIRQQLVGDIEDFSPLGFLKKAEELEKETQEKAINVWCLGYLQGSRLDVEYWREQQDAEVDKYFYPMILLAGDTSTIAENLEGVTQEHIEAALQQAREHLLDAVVSIYRITH
jgi:yecA family protein